MESREKFLNVAKENQADLIGMSALLTTTLGNMKNVVDHVKKSDLGIKVIVGGAPVTEDFAEKIAADGFAPIFEPLSCADVAKAGYLEKTINRTGLSLLIGSLLPIVSAA